MSSETTVHVTDLNSYCNNLYIDILILNNKLF